MIFTCGIYQPFQDASHNKSTLKCERGSEVFLFLVSLKCSPFYPHAHCSPTCGAYILSQRSFFGQVENSETSEITETSESDFPMFPFPSFRLRHRVYSKTRKMKTRKIFSEVSEISEKSEFSNCHFLPNF